MKRVIDMRSDTVTRPGRRCGAPWPRPRSATTSSATTRPCNRLQEHTARLLGKEAALFFPSGTMTNQVALHALTQRGDEVFLHAEAHILFYEQGGAAVLSQLQLRCFASPDGTLDLELMDGYVHHDDDVHFAPTRLVCLENTHNHCGGVVYPLEQIRAVRDFCDRHGLMLHLDGARIWNAHVASGVPLAEIAAPCDTVSVCLSKGLGAPVGSVLVGDAPTIALARRARKLFGGGMRQAGILAAAGLYALEHNIERMADDHRRARALAERLATRPRPRRRPRQGPDEHGLRRHARHGPHGGRARRALWPPKASWRSTRALDPALRHPPRRRRRRRRGGGGDRRPRGRAAQ